MNKFFKYIIISIVIVVLAFTLYKVSSEYSLNIIDNNIDCSVIAKGCENAKALEVDGDNIYIAFKDKIECIDKDGKKSSILKNKDLNIEDIAIYNNQIIYISDDKLQMFSLDKKIERVLKGDIPKSGNGIDRKLLVYKDKLYLSIGSVTNSGISESEEQDLSPIDITLNGENYDGTGAFKKNGLTTNAGEKIKASVIGNAAFYNMDLNSDKLILYASGIRGITGFDINSQGKIMSIFSGMNNEGLRPVNRDKDYIYKVEKGRWYGWPDYSGGDPISSPRFMNDEVIKPIIKNPPRQVIEGPLYQHDSVNSLRELSIDRQGDVLQKDSMIFWDKNRNMISSFSNDGIYSNILKLKSNSNVEDIVKCKNKFLILDNSIGGIYAVSSKNNEFKFNIPIPIWIYIICLLIFLIFLALIKITKKEIK